MKVVTTFAVLLVASLGVFATACADSEQAPPAEDNTPAPPNRPAPKETNTFSEPAPKTPAPVNEFLNTPITAGDAGVGALPPKQLPYEGE